MTTTTADSTTEHEEPPMTTTEVPLPPAHEATSTTGARPAGRLAAVLRSERIKSTTVRANKVLLAVSAIIGLLTSWATATFVTDEALTATDVFVYPTLLTAVLAAIAGIVLFTSEVHHGTLAGSLTAHPSRWPVVAAKTLVAAGFGLLLGVVGMATGFVGALAGGIGVGDTSGVMTTVLWGLLYTVGSALLGLGVGMVVRHSAGAVSGVLVWWLVVESLVVQFAPPEVVRFVPFDTGFRTLGIESDFDVPEVAAAGLSNPLHASIFWGYVVAALALGAAMLVRRDAD
ncbi:MAG: ABC transporter permease [Acidimicrobiales bacterium]|jgi:hypothetical protein|nr:ABC transporter permease [Acidimicrobiales bacterium]